MIQENYPVWRLTGETRKKLRSAGIKATDLAAWAYPDNPAANIAFNGERVAYTYKAKPRWSKARKARAAMRREYPDGMVPADGRRLGPLFADLFAGKRAPGIPNFIMSAREVRDPGHTHAYTCMACGEWVSVLDVHQCAGQPASADPARPFPDDPASRAPLYLDETGKGASAARAEIDIMDALRSAVKENW